MRTSVKRTTLLASPIYIGQAQLLSHFSRVQLCDPIDGSTPGSSVPGIFQARTLEWAAISFSKGRLRGRRKSI